MLDISTIQADLVLILSSTSGFFIWLINSNRKLRAENNKRAVDHNKEVDILNDLNNAKSQAHQVTKNELLVEQTQSRLQTQTIDQLKAELSVISKQRDAIFNQVQGFMERLSTLEKESKVMSNDFDNMKDSFASLKIERDELKKQHDELQANYIDSQKELHDSQAERLKLTLHNKDLVKSNKELVARLESLESKLADYEGKIDKIEKRISTSELKATF